MCCIASSSGSWIPAGREQRCRSSKGICFRSSAGCWRASCPVAAPPASRIPGPYIRRTLPHELHELYFVPAGCDELIRDRAGRSRFKSTRQHTTLVDQVGFYTLSAHTEDTLAAPPPDPQFTTPGKEPVYVSKVSEGSVPEFCPDRRPCGGRYEVWCMLRITRPPPRKSVAGCIRVPT
jgi:hypothetical protein